MKLLSDLWAVLKYTWTDGDRLLREALDGWTYRATHKREIIEAECHRLEEEVRREKEVPDAK